MQFKANPVQIFGLAVGYKQSNIVTQKTTWTKAEQAAYENDYKTAHMLVIVVICFEFSFRWQTK